MVVDKNTINFYEHPHKFQRDACGVGFIADRLGRNRETIIPNALTMLSRLSHRGGIASDGESGDGAGIMIGIPHDIFESCFQHSDIKRSPQEEYAVGVLFTSRDEEEWSKECIQRVVENEGLRLFLWRTVPVDSEVLGAIARQREPVIRHFFISRGESCIENFEWKLFLARKAFENKARERFGIRNLSNYIVSLSTKTIVYKGMIKPDLLSSYYEDLRDPRIKSSFALVHQRFSTNTLPCWSLAQPFRVLGHNGEINTLRGNINWMRSRELMIRESYGDETFEKLKCICTPSASDSAILDNVIDLIHKSGQSLSYASSIIMPEAWENSKQVSSELKSFYEYHSLRTEPWDGPALVCFADGDVVGAKLDRNGLRPARYCQTADDLLILASEAGVVDYHEEHLLEKGILGPGESILLDRIDGRILKDSEIKYELANFYPYESFNRIHSLEDVEGLSLQTTISDLDKRINLFSYTKEDLLLIISPMANEGKEAISSMGNDASLGFSATKIFSLFDFFRQLFAQVTNPPIDAIREKDMTSLRTYLGKKGNLISPHLERISSICLKSPILTNSQITEISKIKQDDLMLSRVSICYDYQQTKLSEAIEYLRKDVRSLVKSGQTIIVLSDVSLNEGTLAIPSILAVSAVHHDLINHDLRGKCSIVLESGEPREVHHFCVLLGYGADAINPYLVLDLVSYGQKKHGLTSAISDRRRQDNYIQAVNQGLLKVMSKMGISVVQSYRGAQVFEVLGLSQELVDEYFTWTPSRLGGLTIEDIDRRLIRMTKDRALSSLPHTGKYQWRRGGESHLHSPDVIVSLQRAASLSSRDEFKDFCSSVDDQEEMITLRGGLGFTSVGSIEINEVESVDTILSRFATGAMSLGSISREAHETIAIGMNSIGGKSNSGEGGEDPDRFVSGSDDRCSYIKQVASGRFGVTSHYLVNCKEIQIKIAQGAKPGEGGQLPGHKVDAYIAKVRHSSEGVTLISPPPHHDIYSIEDLAQLIFDLKSVNPQARISVKLVSSSGVGTIAAGVAKAKADVILISGADGGTGASPLTSIKHAGLPWELGLSETHRTLLDSGLRTRVRLQVDGQLRTPKDLAVATILGAEEWGIGTGALIVLGCIMMRKCHLNSCPVGIATQNPILRERFRGQPQSLVNYLILLAEGLREIMAELGVKSVNDLVGRIDLLKIVQNKVDNYKLDLSEILRISNTGTNRVFDLLAQDHQLEQRLDRAYLLPNLKEAIHLGKPKSLNIVLKNTDRAVGAMISGEITRLYGAEGLAPGSVRLYCKGTAGQSFMAFACKGLTAILEGDVNDYLGKGLCGGQVIIKSLQSKQDSNSHLVCGNVALYGATSGQVHIQGRAGERFAVRNSGAVAIVEGVGCHGCEYMTGGTVVILGEVGLNFAAGMSGGKVFIYDPKDLLEDRINISSVSIHRALSKDSEAVLYRLIKQHAVLTDSSVAIRILDAWKDELNCFRLILPVQDAAPLLKDVDKNEKIMTSRVNVYHQEVSYV